MVVAMIVGDLRFVVVVFVGIHVGVLDGAYCQVNTL
jgi:hypothetical protein